MPKVKELKCMHRNKAGAVDGFDVDIYVDVQGQFYARPPEYLMEICQNQPGVSVKVARRKAKPALYSASLQDLERAMKLALCQHMEPEVTEELVIRYNLESRVMFAEDDEGNIYPNCYVGGAGSFWPRQDGRYGRLSTVSPAAGGYMLRIGADAVKKITRTYGDKKEVSYENYYGEEGDHLTFAEEGDHQNCGDPAALLNAWPHITFKDFKEMPYTPERAMFFYKLLKSMVEISRNIQGFAAEQDKLLELIESGAAMLPAPRQGDTEHER